jgi:hypothetical protein
VEKRSVFIVFNGLRGCRGSGRGRQGEGEMGRRENSCSVLFGAWALSGRECVRVQKSCVCANLFCLYSRVHISFSSQWVSCGCALLY